MIIIKELYKSYLKFQEIKKKAIDKNNNSILLEFEKLILESIKIFERTSEEMYLERLLEGNETLKHNQYIKENDYVEILDNINNLNFKLNFLQEYKKRKIIRLKKDIEYLKNTNAEIQKMDFSITNSLEQITDINIPYKKIMDFSIINKNNCDIENNLVKFENFNVYEENVNKSIDITKHNININFFGAKKNVFYVSLTNTKIANNFIVNIKQNGINKNVYNGKLKHNAIINIAAENVEDIVIYSEADISYILDTVKVKCFNGNSTERKGFFVLNTNKINEISNAYIKSEYNFQSYIFDETVEVDYNNTYEDMLNYCENNLNKISFNEDISLSINKKFNIICFFNTDKNCANLPDFYYE